MKKLSELKVALVYDRVNKWGGAERVLLSLNKLFPKAPLYTSVCNQKTANWAKVFPKVIPSFLQNFPLVRNHHELFPYLMPLAFESFDFSRFDLVISVTSESAKGIITKPTTLHICYLLTPTRYLWSGEDEYFKNPVTKAFTYPLRSYLKKWDKIAAQRPDVVVGISKTVVHRIQKYYGRNAKLIYPPVTPLNTNFSPPLPTKMLRGSYYLIVGRLIPYKKFDLVINVFNKLKKPLVVIGTGSLENKLRKQARKNITFVGFVTDSELINYYKFCKALIFPQNEDFGIVAVEAQLYGKPVIAYRLGGAAETVIEGKTGIFFETQTPDSLANAIYKFENTEFKQKDCIKNAAKFTEKIFLDRFAKLISAVDIKGK